MLKDTPRQLKTLDTSIQTAKPENAKAYPSADSIIDAIVKICKFHSKYRRTSFCRIDADGPQVNLTVPDSPTRLKQLSGAACI